MSRLATLLVLCASVLAAPALAHGLLVQARAEGDAVVGRVFYSDGRAGAGEFVELRDLAGGTAASGPTDAEGRFRFPARVGRQYSVVAHGEEGHTTEVRLTAAAGERARLAEPAATEASGVPPAWAVIGGLLVLLTAPAIWLRLRARRFSSSRR